MLKPLPYRDGDRFVILLGGSINDPEHYSDLRFGDARTYQERTRAFDAFGWFRQANKNLVFAGEPQHIQGIAVTPPLVRQLGVDPVHGQWFHGPNEVVISNSLWRKLGGDPGIVGKALALDGLSYTVSGVMPAAFHLPVAGASLVGVQADLWMPLDPKETGGGFFAYARRKPGVTLAAAESDVQRVAAQIAAEDPVRHPGYTARLLDLRQTVVKDIRPTLLLLFGAAGLLFLVACANTAGLLLARSAARSRETAIRVALGPGRGHLALHYFAEGFMVALAGATGGVVLSVTLTPVIVSMAADYLPRADEIAVDWTVLLFALAGAFIASAVSSLAPLWQAARTAPADVLAEGVRASASVRTRRLSELLVVAEIALAFGLLAVSAVLLVHLRDLSRFAFGFDPDHVLTFVLSVPGTSVDSDQKRVILQNRIIAALHTIPGVDDVAISNHVPLNGCCPDTSVYPDGRPIDPNESQRNSLMEVSPEYFRAMRVPLRSGRLFTDLDVVKDMIWVVLNQTAAKHYWGNQDPVGAFGRFGSPSGRDRFQVIGVVGDVKNDGAGNPTVPEFYIQSFIDRIESMNVVMRSNRTTASLLPDIRSVIRTIDPEQPITEVATMQEVIERTMTLERLSSVITTFFAAAALLLAMLGIYGVVSYSVRQRTVEIGTRMALGARASGILAAVVGGGLRMAAFGIAAGGAASIGATYYLSRIFKFGPLETAPFLYSTTTVAAMAFAASVLPGWRAALLSPMVAIRNEPEPMWKATRLKLRRAMRKLSAHEVPTVPLGILIGEFTNSIRRADSFSEAVRMALAALQERTGAESALLLERTSGEFRSAQYSIPANGVLLHRLQHYWHPLELSADDFETWLRWAREFKPEHTAEIETLANTGARMAVALRAKNEIVGVLLLGAPSGRENYAAAEKEVFNSSAEVFALMIENARLADRALEQERVQRDLELAAEVQRRLMPDEAPAGGPIALAAFSLPARTVGGDYYDFFELGQERIGIALADISGKGIAAALLMSVVQASLRVISTQGDMSLSELAARMNGFIHRSTASNKFSTFFYAQFEQRGRTLRYVNAGHNPPYLVRRSNGFVQLEELSAGGTVLGLFPDIQYDESRLDLHPGDLLVAFTDGVTEALNAEGQEFGEERLKDFLLGANGETAEEISSRLTCTIREWIGDAEQHDDLTFVIVAVK